MTQPEDYQYDATVLDVHDGDTVTVSIKVHKVWLKDQDLTLHMHVEGKWLTLHTAVRLNHIDAPELNTDAGKIARDVLKQRLLGKEITLYTMKNPEDKYGRWLGLIFEGGECINVWMMKNGYAKPYEGGKKTISRSNTPESGAITATRTKNGSHGSTSVSSASTTSVPSTISGKIMDVKAPITSSKRK